MGAGFGCTRDADDSLRFITPRQLPGCHGVPAACGKVGGVFFEPEGSVTKETWHYVGEGRGGYAKMQTYSYVGDGMGTFEKDASSRCSCGRCLCIGTLSLVFLSAAVYFLCLFMEVDPLQALPPDLQSRVKKWEKVAEDDLSASGQKLQKAMNDFIEEKSGSGPKPVDDDEQHFPAPIARSSDVRFHCVPGREEARIAAAVFAEWTAMDTDQDGLVSTSEIESQRETFSDGTLALLLKADLNSDGKLTHEEFTDALTKREEAKGAKEHSETSEKEIKAWTPEKREWCCAHAGIGCPLTPPPPKTEAPTEKPKKHSSGKAAPPPPPPPGTPPPPRVSAATTEAPAAQAPRPKPRFDCKAGLDGWQVSWTAEKREWCCQEESKGCSEKRKDGGCETMCKFEDVTASCKDRVHWAAKHLYKNEPGSCASAITTVLEHCSACAVCSLTDAQCMEASPVELQAPKGHFDCEAGLDSWKSTWSTSKKVWCCEKHNKGCEDGPTGEVMCEAVDNWKTAWSDTQKAWCCKHKQIGCQPADASPEFNCDNGYSTWNWGWSDEKKGWCCKNHNKGCPGDA